MQALKKKLEAKGKVGPKLLRKLAGKRLELGEQQLSPGAMKQLRKEVGG